MWIKILCIEYILWGIPTIESTFDVANIVKTATVKDVPINSVRKMGPAIKDSLFDVPQGAPHFGLSKMT